MTRDVMQCAYDGAHVDLDDAVVQYAFVRWVDENTALYTTAVFCSRYCGRRWAEREHVQIGGTA